LGAIASGCSTKPVEPTLMLQMTQPSVPETAKQACPPPVKLPDRDLTEGETTSLWGSDRAALVNCDVRRDAAVKAVEPEAQKRPLARSSARHALVRRRRKNAPGRLTTALTRPF
jgi:hypothetical protein